MRALALAGLSARLMTETAAHDGFAATALDVFGDADTQRAARHWHPIGDAQALRIDGPRFLDTLAGLRDHAGWVAGSGFEPQPDLLQRGAAILPLIGTGPDAVTALRDPATFFGFLRDAGIDHPPVLLADDGAWLLKNARSAGGAHIRRWQTGQYLQREAPGVAMSATFVGNGADVCVFGVNRQIVRPVGAHPHVVCGVVGPLPVAGALLQQLTAIARRLTQRFALRGLASLDVLVDGSRVQVLEVNPRPPASLALYRALRPMAAHVQACLHGELPPPQPAPPLLGHEVVFADRALRLSPSQADTLASCPDVHDLPAAGQDFAAGAPLCSITCAGSDAADVMARLQRRRDALLRSLENGP